MGDLTPSRKKLVKNLSNFKRIALRTHGLCDDDVIVVICKSRFISRKLKEFLVKKKHYSGSSILVFHDINLGIDFIDKHSDKIFSLFISNDYFKTNVVVELCKYLRVNSENFFPIIVIYDKKKPDNLCNGIVDGVLKVGYILKALSG